VDVPQKFLPLGLVRLLATRLGAKALARMLNNINPFSNDDLFDRYVSFFNTSKLGSQEAILDQCRQYYPEGTGFVILPMDMAFMGAGKVTRPYEQQLDELADMASRIPGVIPFMHIDPRRPGIVDLFRKYVEEKGFRGVKLYPPLGYFPYDEGLYPIYEYCNKNNLPVMTHCSPHNLVHFRGSRKELEERLARSNKPIMTKGVKKKDLYTHFTHPSNYEPLLKEFSNLRICVAHFGSGEYWKQWLEEPSAEDNWFRIIRDMIKKYDNFYTDVSFTLNNGEFFSLLKVLMYDDKIRRKILFGSDYYMVQTKTDERRFGIDLRAFLGDEYFKLISEGNPKRYLGI
jgi:predicted TIM-barrel fold metal-dependent hydrolase